MKSRAIVVLVLAAICVSGPVSAQIIPDRFEIGETIFWGEWYPDSTVKGVTENERTIMRELALTNIATTPNDLSYLRYLDSLGGTIKFIVTNVPGMLGDCAGVWIPCMAERANEYPSPGWIDSANMAVDSFVSFGNNHVSLMGYHISSEGPECCTPEWFAGAEYLAQRVHQEAPRTDLKTWQDGYDNGKAMGFFEGVPDMDIVAVYIYPFTGIAPVQTATLFNGPTYQWAIWDASLARSFGYDRAGRDFRDEHATWWAGYSAVNLDVGNPGYRGPTPPEIRCQVWLGLSRGAKGIIHFSLGAAIAPGAPLASEGVRYRRWEPFPTLPGGGFYPYDVICDINRELQKVGPYLLPLRFEEGFTSSAATIPPTFVTGVSRPYVEVGTFTDRNDGSKWFILVNRACNNDDGSPRGPRGMRVSVALGTSPADSTFLIADILGGDTLRTLYAGGEQTLRVSLEPGAGRLYHILGSEHNANGTDQDGDGIEDGLDNCWTVYNPGQEDTDADSIGDACDLCLNDAWNDQDGDGLCGDVDACPEDSLNDIDGDGICANLDNCPNAYNPGQEDTDGDGFGDACDNCAKALVSLADRDGDGIGDCCDNCPDTYNPDQLNSDGDQFANACDNCLFVTNNSQVDADGDGIGDACESYHVIAGVRDTTALPGSGLVWTISLANDVYIDEIEIPITLSNVPLDATFDSVVATGCRAEYFEKKMQTVDNRPNGQAAIYMKADNGGGAPPLAPGSGPVAKIYVTIKPSAVDRSTIAISVGQLGTHIYLTKGPDVAFPNTFQVGRVTIGPPCECACHADPASCDQAQDVLDVVQTINVAFRGQAAIPDPYGNCPYQTTDVDCSGDTGVLDVVHMINVAFRGIDANAQFCNPCP